MSAFAVCGLSTMLSWANFKGSFRPRAGGGKIGSDSFVSRAKPFPVLYIQMSRLKEKEQQ